MDSLPAGVPLAPKEAAPCTLQDSLTEPHKALRKKLGLGEAPASEPVETDAELFLRDDFFRKVDVCNRWKQKAVEAMLFLDTAKFKVLLQEAASLHITRAILVVTCVGHLIGDNTA